MKIIIHPHAKLRMEERGVPEEEIIAAIENGERFEAKFDRVAFRRNFAFGGMWRGKIYSTKQVEVFAIEEHNQWLVITVIARYF